MIVAIYVPIIVAIIVPTTVAATYILIQVCNLRTLAKFS